jgi:hypothetical protein
VWEVRYVEEARKEREVLPSQEQVALDRAVAKLAVLGPQLSFPHQSAIRGASQLRELRPRPGRSLWRALYTRIGDTFVVFAVAPEAQYDPHGFSRAVDNAAKRLQEVNAP